MTAPPDSPDGNIEEGYVPDWVRWPVRRLKPIPLGREFNWPYFHTLNLRTVEAITEDGQREVDLSGLSLIPTFTLSRTTQQIRKDDESFVLFDCLHAATTRTFYYHLTTGSAQQQLLDFLKEHLASSLLNVDDEVEALALSDEKIPIYYMRGLPQPPEYYFEQTLISQSTLPQIPLEEAFELIDLFKACHEIFHFLIQRGAAIVSPYQGMASDLFIHELDVLYPEQVDEERLKLLERTGALSPDQPDRPSTQSALSEMYKEYRQKLLEKQARESLVEEIACDLFAIRVVSLWRIRAQQKGLASALTIVEIFGTLFLIANLIRLVEFYTERASDIKAGRNTFHNQDASRALHVRNAVLHSYILEFAFQLTDDLRNIKGMPLSTDEKKFILNSINSRHDGISSFLKMHVEYPLGMALHHMVHSVRAKLRDDQIRELYEEAVEGLTFAQKVVYTLPVIEDFAVREYFADKPSEGPPKE